MKITLKLFFVIVIIVLHSCSPKLQPYPAEVNFLYKEANGTIVVKSIGYGKNQTDAVTDAEKNAFNVILFKGLPGTELNIPLIENESEAKSKHVKYFRDFFDYAYYKSFTMSSTESCSLIKLKGNQKISVDIKINFNSLRKDLEQNQLIRRFGY